jgi:hypothetical protein
MRQMRSLDYTDVDTQQCLIKLSEILEARGIQEQDVISVQRFWNDSPVPITGSNRSQEGNVTIFIFYWSELTPVS